MLLSKHNGPQHSVSLQIDALKHQSCLWTLTERQEFLQFFPLDQMHIETIGPDRLAKSKTEILDPIGQT